MKILLLTLLFSTMVYAKPELPPVEHSETYKIKEVCKRLAKCMPDRVEFIKNLRDAKSDDGEVLKIKLDAGVPQFCIDVDEY